MKRRLGNRYKSTIPPPGEGRRRGANGSGRKRVSLACVESSRSEQRNSLGFLWLVSWLPRWSRQPNCRAARDVEDGQREARFAKFAAARHGASSVVGKMQVSRLHGTLGTGPAPAAAASRDDLEADVCVQSSEE